MVYASIECGSVGYTEAEFTTKVERRLESGEQTAAEYGLWTGLAADSNLLGIPNFSTDGIPVTPPDPTSIVSVLSALEDFAYRQEGYGNIAYVHAPVSMASWAASQRLVVKDGNLLKTPFGSVWVFGAGYPGTGIGGVAPPAGGAYLFVTGQITVWRSRDVFTSPINLTLDRKTNQRFLLSEREYAIGVDCFMGGALYNPGT